MAERSVGDGVKEKQRYVETKFYTRKALNNFGKNNKDNTNSISRIASVATSVFENREDNDDIRNKETSTAPTITTPTPTNTNNNNDDSNINSGFNNDNDNNLPRPLMVTEDESQTQSRLILRINVASDYSSCPNRLQFAAGDDVHNTWDQPSLHGVENLVENHSDSSMASRLNHEVRELCHKLESELEMVRNVLGRIEVKLGELIEASNFHGSANEGMYRVGEDNQIRSEVASVRVPRQRLRPRQRYRSLNQLSMSMLENSQGVIDYVKKERRTPKANALSPSSEFLLGKDKLPPAESNKKVKLKIKKSSVGKIPPGFGLNSKFLKSCSTLLDRLIKHKYGWVFDTPVNVEGLGLHDYHIIIKHPMDLGTVKSRLNKNWYKLPKEFAEDVRLTFRNAMTYNPPGQGVHEMADQLLTIFEDRWANIESDYNREMRFGLDYRAALSAPTFRKGRLPPPLDESQIFEKSESTTYRFDSKNKPLRSTPSARTTPASKKPLAKDPCKRDMTFEEKQKLSSNLQNLLSVNQDAIIRIVKKRNPGILQDDEQIEIEIDRLDAETLWELDRFVINFRKSLNKKQRKVALAFQARGDDKHNIAQKAPGMMEVRNESKADENFGSTSVLIQGQGYSRSRSFDSGSSSSGSDSESS